MTDVEVSIAFEAPIRPTEVPERVRQAVLNIFPDAEVDLEAGRLRGTARSLARLAELVANHRIPDTARAVMLRGVPGEGASVTRFVLGKQAAFVGRPNFDPPEGPLGDVRVEVSAPSGDDLEQAIYDMAPDTTVEAALAHVPRSKRPPPPELP